MPTIAELNDAHRKGIPRTKTVISRWVDRLWPDTVDRVLRKVREFDDFNSDNDPYGERDYGSIELDDEKFYFKIDYFDTDFRYWSEDPSDPSKTARLLTVALRSEY